MQSRTSVLLAALIFAVGLVITPATPAAAANGFDVRVVAEFPSDMPGIEKLVLLEVTVEPGGKKENFAIEGDVL